MKIFLKIKEGDSIQTSIFNFKNGIRYKSEFDSYEKPNINFKNVILVDNGIPPEFAWNQFEKEKALPIGSWWSLTLTIPTYKSFYHVTFRYRSWTSNIYSFFKTNNKDYRPKKVFKITG